METDDRILDAALRVFLAEGLRGATTRKIADEAGVNEVTLFRRFGSKERLLMDALRHDAVVSAVALPLPSECPLADLAAWNAATLRRLSRVRGLIQVAMGWIDESPALCERAREGPARIRAEIARWFDHLRADGRARADFDSDLAARMLMGALFGEVMRPDGVGGPPAEDLGRVAEAFARLALRGIGVEES